MDSPKKPNAKQKFGMKHVFPDFASRRQMGLSYGKTENHSKLPWRIRVSKKQMYVAVYLECLKFCGSKEWSIDVNVDLKLFNKNEEEMTSRNDIFTQNTDLSRLEPLKIIEMEDLDNYLIDGHFVVELHVAVNKIKGVRFEKQRSFSNNMAKELSDVVLIVNNEKFHVLKMYLASHSTYFKSLLLGNFSESEKSEIELKDIDPHDFQNFLDLIHAESEVNDDNVEGILHLADMYDSKTAIRKCEEFLINKTERSLTVKFNLANKYKLEKLKKKCMSEIKTAADIQSVMPADPSQIDYVVWKQLLNKCLQLVPKKG